MLLNPDLQYPYQIELDELQDKRFEASKKELSRRLLEQVKPSFSSKYSFLQANNWLKVDESFEECTNFMPTDRLSAARPVAHLLTASENRSISRDIPLSVEVKARQWNATTGWWQLGQRLPGTSRMMGPTATLYLLWVLLTNFWKKEQSKEVQSCYGVNVTSWGFCMLGLVCSRRHQEYIYLFIYLYLYFIFIVFGVQVVWLVSAQHSAISAMIY